MADKFNKDDHTRIFKAAKYGSLVECNLDKVRFEYSIYDEMISDAVEVKAAGYDVVVNGSMLFMDVTERVSG